MLVMDEASANGSGLSHCLNHDALPRYRRVRIALFSAGTP